MELQKLTKLVLPFAWFATAIGGFTMGPAKGMWKPQWPSDEAFTDDMPPLTIWTLNHWLKNIMVECVRRDPQYWAKMLSMIILIQSVVVLLLLAL